MISAAEARRMAREANEGINKEQFDRMREKIWCDVQSEADTGHRGAYFRYTEFLDMATGADMMTGIEFVVEELRDQGFKVKIDRDLDWKFVAMYVSW